MSFHLYFFAIFISLWGSTHDSVDCKSAHRSPAARDSFKHVHDWWKAGCYAGETMVLVLLRGGPWT